MSDIAVVHLDVCDSTQDEVRTRLTSVAEGGLVAVSAASQRAGRGRAGRAWQDPPGAALMLSAGRRGPLPVSVLDDLPRRVASALLGVIDAGARVCWKAPNDLVDTAGAKLAGILVDARTTGTVVDEVIVGVGINLAGDPFTTSDGRDATTLEALGVPVDAARLRTALIELLEGA